MSPSRARCLLPAAGGLMLLTIACGKKGPPLAPFPDLPAAVADLTARRVGPRVLFQFTVPVANIDNRRPADLVRVELYASDRRLLRPADYLDVGARVGTIDVRPADADEDTETDTETDTDAAGNEGPAVGPGPRQGTVVVIAVDPDAPLPPARRIVAAAPGGGPPAEVLLWPGGGGPLVPTRAARFPTRFFVAAGVNRRGRHGLPSAVVEVPAIDTPSPPGDVRLTYTEQAITVAWTPPPDLRRPIQNPVAEDEALPSRALPVFITASGYNVYEVPAPDDDEGAVEAPPRGGPLPVPLNPVPLAEARFEYPRAEFGVERCFVVRARDAVGAVVLESSASPVACVEPADTFPPPPPENLTLVASEGTISLIWNPSSGGDVAGYLVLRGEAPGDKLQALTAAPVTETTYRDTRVTSGVAYVYAVVAVDRAGNVGAQSTRVEERGR